MLAVSLTRAHAYDVEGWRYVGRFAVRGMQVFAVGGAYGSPMFLHSRDGGLTFQRLQTPPTTGLRDILLDDEAIWVVGEQGRVARTTDLGASWTSIDLGTDECIYAIARDPQRRYWIGGTAGILWRSADGATFERVPSSSRENVFHLWWDPKDGQPWLCGIETLMRWDGTTFTPLATKSPVVTRKPSVAEIVRTPAGTLVAVGRESLVMRSATDGQTWKRIGAASTDDVEAIAVTPYGVFVVGAGVRVSYDDAKTFSALGCDETGHVWAVARVPTGLLLGADHGIFRIAASELAKPFAVAHARDPILVALAERVQSCDEGAELVLEDALRERGAWA